MDAAQTPLHKAIASPKPNGLPLLSMATCALSRIRPATAHRNTPASTKTTPHRMGLAPENSCDADCSLRSGIRLPIAAETPNTMEKVRPIPIASMERPNRTCARPHPAPQSITTATTPGPASPYTAPSEGTVINAATAGRSNSAKSVHASQIFSQAHCRAYFIGSAKAALATPAIVTKINPETVPVICILPPRNDQRHARAALSRRHNFMHDLPAESLHPNLRQ